MKTKWKPIKSAPKDGTRILLYNGKGYSYLAVGYYDDSPQLGGYPDWHWGFTIDPTHWMELPEPPK